jgi:hypothetical protein
MYTIKEPTVWMTDREVNRLAVELVEEFADGTANDQLAALLTSLREGAKINGKSVYIRKLMGALKGMCPELLDDVMALGSSTPKTKFKYRT